MKNIHVGCRTRTTKRMEKAFKSGKGNKQKNTWMPLTWKTGRETRKVHGRCDLVSLTGAVAFEKVAKVRIRQVQLDRDPMWSVRTYTCQTVRMTIRAGMKGRNFGSVFGRS